MTPLAAQLEKLADHLDAAIAGGCYYEEDAARPHLRAALSLQGDLLSQSDASTPRWVKFALEGCQSYSQYEQEESLRAHAKLVRVLAGAA